MFAKILGRAFEWLGDRTLCPCGLTYRFAERLGLTDTKNKFLVWVFDKSVRLCGLILCKTQISPKERKQLDKIEAARVLEEMVRQGPIVEIKRSTDKLWN